MSQDAQWKEAARRFYDVPVHNQVAIEALYLKRKCGDYDTAALEKAIFDVMDLEFAERRIADAIREYDDAIAGDEIFAKLEGK